MASFLARVRWEELTAQSNGVVNTSLNTNIRLLPAAILHGKCSQWDLPLQIWQQWRAFILHPVIFLDFFFSIWALPQCRLLQICSLNRMGPGEKTGERYPYFTNCQEAQELAPVALRELMLLQVHDVVKGTPQPILPLGVYSISSMRYSKLYCKWTLQWKTSLSCKRG